MPNLSRGRCAAPTERLIDEGEVVRSGAGAAVLVDLPIGRLQEEGGESTDGLSLRQLRLLLGTHHSDMALLAVHFNGALLNEFLEVGLGLLTVAAPIGIVHCEGGLTGILESLDGS